MSLIPPHPDRVGGLGFLSNTAYAFGLLVLAHGTLLAGQLANRIFYLGATLPEFKGEIALMVVPMVLLYQATIRMRPGALYACAVMVLFGFIANRLNVGTTGLEAGSGTHYIPKWSEVAVTLSIVAAGFAIFRAVVQYFPVFEAHSHDSARAEVEEPEVVLM